MDNWKFSAGDYVVWTHAAIDNMFHPYNILKITYVGAIDGIVLGEGYMHHNMDKTNTGKTSKDYFEKDHRLLLPMEKVLFT